jgi:hypothetical protein
VGSWRKGIGVITLFVGDLEAATRFDVEVGGPPLTFEDDDSAVFDLGTPLVDRGR